MNIKGFQKSSFIDYPDKIAAVVFTGGCNFKCPYCHNRDLVYNLGEQLDEDDIVEQILYRKKYIDGVCISGGEPTLQEDLLSFIDRLKSENLLVKLDTNGTNPELIERLIEEGKVDYIAMDIKSPMSKYRNVSGAKVDTGAIEKSIGILKNSSIDYEFRTTICKELLSASDIVSIAKDIKGSKKYTLQNFKDSGNILSTEVFTPYKREELKIIENELEQYFDKFLIRY